MKKKHIFAVLAAAAAALAPSICAAQENGKTNTSIAMLNYLATETRLINTEKNNRLMLEETYNKLINNTNPGIVDETTQDFLQVMLDDIENFRISSVQRERLQYILENQRAQAITQAMPNPLYLLGLTAPGGTKSIATSRSHSFNANASGNVSFPTGSVSAGASYAYRFAENITKTIMNPWKLIGTLSVMTLDSIFKYQSALDDANMSFLKENWQLDDNESATLHNLRSQTFNYMIYIARNNKLDAADTLNEESIDNFVKICADTNFERRKQSLEDNRALYSKYAPYYLELAKTYYELEQYKECIDAIDKYGAVKTSIFRKDYDYAQALPKAVIAAAYVYGLDENYAGICGKYLDELIKNTSGKDWELRYFAAQSYMNMAAITETEANLTKAYTVLLENVTHLSKQQEQYLADYINPVKENADKVQTKAQKKQSEKTIKELKKARETELPPLSQPLVVNYEALRLLMDELEISAQERQRINAIVRDAFINPAFFNTYFPDKKIYEAGEIVFKRRNITVANKWKSVKLNLPAGFLSKDSTVNFRILANENVIGEGTEYTIKKVDRNKQADIDKFKVYSVLKPSGAFTIKRNQEYVCKLTITTFDVPQTLVFSCPAGKINFTYQGMENADIEIVPKIESDTEPETAVEINQTAIPAINEPVKDGLFKKVGRFFVGNGSAIKGFFAGLWKKP